MGERARERATPQKMTGNDIYTHTRTNPLYAGVAGTRSSTSAAPPPPPAHPPPPPFCTTSWPHAPEMSCPFSARTVTRPPHRRRKVFDGARVRRGVLHGGGRCARRGVGRVARRQHRVPGDEVEVQPGRRAVGRAQQGRQGGRICWRVVDARQQHVLHKYFLARDHLVGVHGGHELGERVGPGGGDDGRPPGLGGRVQGEGQRHARQVAGQVGQAGDDADRGDGHPGPAQGPAGRGGHAAGRPAHGGIVVQGLAHPHKHHVPGGRLARPRQHGRRPVQLLHNLARRQVAQQAHRPRRAKLAGHGAPDLGRHAHRRPPPARRFFLCAGADRRAARLALFLLVSLGRATSAGRRVVPHDDGLDVQAVLEAEEELGRAAVGRGDGLGQGGGAAGKGGRQQGAHGVRDAGRILWEVVRVAEEVTGRGKDGRPGVSDMRRERGGRSGAAAAAAAQSVCLFVSHRYTEWT